MHWYQCCRQQLLQSTLKIAGKVNIVFRKVNNFRLRTQYFYVSQLCKVKISFTFDGINLKLQTTHFWLQIFHNLWARVCWTSWSRTGTARGRCWRWSWFGDVVLFPIRSSISVALRRRRRLLMRLRHNHFLFRRYLRGTMCRTKRIRTFANAPSFYRIIIRVFWQVSTAYGITVSVGQIEKWRESGDRTSKCQLLRLLFEPWYMLPRQ